MATIAHERQPHSDFEFTRKSETWARIHQTFLNAGLRKRIFFEVYTSPRIFLRAYSPKQFRTDCKYRKLQPIDPGSRVLPACIVRVLLYKIHSLNKCKIRYKMQQEGKSTRKKKTCVDVQIIDH